MRSLDAVTSPLGGSDAAATPRLRVAVLGPLWLRHPDGRNVAPALLQTTKTRHLLRLLAIDAAGISRETLVEHLWPGTSADRGRASLRTAASVLRRRLDGHVVSDGDRLVLVDADVDVRHFLQDATTAERRILAGDRWGGLATADAALARWRGDLAEDEPYLDELLRARDRLGRRRIELLILAAETALALDQPREALAHAQGAADLDPASERPCRLVMRAYHRLGDRAQVRRTYDRCERQMRDGYGLRPSTETVALLHALTRDLPSPARDPASGPETWT